MLNYIKTAIAFMGSKENPFNTCIFFASIFLCIPMNILSKKPARNWFIWSKKELAWNKSSQKRFVTVYKKKQTTK